MVSTESLGEPKRVPKGTLEAKVVPRWTIGVPEGANANVSHPIVRPRGAQGDPRRAQRGGKGSPEGGQGSPKDPRRSRLETLLGHQVSMRNHCFYCSNRYILAWRGEPEKALGSPQGPRKRRRTHPRRKKTTKWRKRRAEGEKQRKKCEQKVWRSLTRAHFWAEL